MNYQQIWGNVTAEDLYFCIRFSKGEKYFNCTTSPRLSTIHHLMDYIRGSILKQTVYCSYHIV